LKKSKIKYLIIAVITSTLFSCGGWSKKDKKKYITECQRAKLDSTFCECSLNKITSKYNSFDHAMRNESDFIEIFMDCKN
jgi:hypothetical protein